MQQPATRPGPASLPKCDESAVLNRNQDLFKESVIFREAFLLVRHARSKLELGQPAFHVVSVVFRLELKFNLLF